MNSAYESMQPLLASMYVAKHISMPVNAFYAWSSTMHSNYVLSFQLWLSQSCTTADNERFGYNLNPKIIEVSSVLTCSIGSRNAQQVWQENSTTRRSNWPTARLLVIYTLTTANMWTTLPKPGQATVTYAMHCQHTTRTRYWSVTHSLHVYTQSS